MIIFQKGKENKTPTIWSQGVGYCLKKIDEKFKKISKKGMLLRHFCIKHDGCYGADSKINFSFPCNIQNSMTEGEGELQLLGTDVMHLERTAFRAMERSGFLQALNYVKKCLL